MIKPLEQRLKIRLTKQLKSYPLLKEDWLEISSLKTHSPKLRN